MPANLLITLGKRKVTRKWAFSNLDSLTNFIYKQEKGIKKIDPKTDHNEN